MASRLVLLGAALAVAAANACAQAPEQLIGGNVESLLEFARDRHPEFAALRAEAEAAAARIRARTMDLPPFGPFGPRSRF